ncbi:MAG: YXWGXW repeat-containing protein [Chthoniobacterales bacterium]|nr:YXWGXW repeat-containing protein [Chthoniobacterales bacterium]
MKTTLLKAIEGGKQLKTRLCVAAAAPLMLVGCTATINPVPLATADASYGVSTGVVVARRPPVTRIEARPASRGSQYVWVSGHWRWTGVDYDWVPGR